MLGGATSEMYMGAVDDRTPIPKPPMKRPMTNWANADDDACKILRGRRQMIV